jgi:hypothetical protein
LLVLPGLAPTAAHARARRIPGGVRCTPPLLNVSAALAGGRVTVSPAPESRDASATTQISLLGVPAEEIARVKVRGTRTGVHAGQLLAYSQGDGASFVPASPFAEGETVRVSVRLAPEGASSVPVNWSFTVAISDPAASSVSGKRPHPLADPRQSFVSRPFLRPPIVTVSGRAASATADLLLAPYGGRGEYGPMILDKHGGLLWFDPLPRGARAADLRVQSYEGKPVLTWWQDPIEAGGSGGAGEVIVDGSYRRIAVIRAGNGYHADLHDFEIAPDGTALMTIYSAIDCNLHALGGPRDGAVADTLFEDLDLRTGLVRYEWHMLDHISLSSSYTRARPTTRSLPWDAYHLNSLDVERDGSLLVDARNTWAAYDVDARSGQVRWELGGRNSSFRLSPGTATAWQHDAREQPDGAITFFDNGATPRVHPTSRAIEVVIDPPHGTVRLRRSYEHRNPLLAGSQGNLQALPNGDWMVGWGEAGYFSEVNRAGHVLFNARLPLGWETYRAYAMQWNGKPNQPPTLALAPGPGGQGMVAYASWNGATAVSAWRVLAGASPAALTPLQTAARSGFETAIALPAAPSDRYVAVQALDATGAVLGTSAVGRA